MPLQVGDHYLAAAGYVIFSFFFNRRASVRRKSLYHLASPDGINSFSRLTFWIAARAGSDGHAHSPQQVSNGLPEILPAVRRRRRTGRSVDLQAAGFQHFLHAIDMVSVAHHDG